MLFGDPMCFDCPLPAVACGDCPFGSHPKKKEKSDDASPSQEGEDFF